MPIYRSSSTGGFGLRENFRPVKSQVAAWAEKHAIAEPIQEKASKVENNSAEKTQNNVAVKAPEQPKEKPKQSAKVVFTLGSPVREENSLEQPKLNYSGKHFTEVCAWYECNKDIIEGKDDAYMYGYLQAFCSDGCRGKQIALDEKLRPSSPKSNGSNSKSVVRPVSDGNKSATIARINRSKRLFTLAHK